MHMKVAVILPAAGLGTRMGQGSAEKAGTSRKQFMLLEGSPILLHTVRKFAASRPRDARSWWRCARRTWNGWRRCWRAEFRGKPRARGGRRQQPPAIGGERAGRARPGHRPGGGARRRAAVHRPGDHSTRCSTKRPQTGAAIVGVVPVDTVKQVSRGTEHVRIRATLPREKLVLAQTPQVFRYDLLKRAFEAAREDGFIGTDESSLVERLDVEVSVVLGSDRNIKITKPGDMDLARLFLREETAEAAQP